jgi:hypothetical protein
MKILKVLKFYENLEFILIFEIFIILKKNLNFELLKNVF